jgi:hypothetical protein
MFITKKSSSGAVAREPKWWGSFFEYYYPDISLGIIEKLALNNTRVGEFIANLPSKCPFERQYWIGDRLIMYVPALCKFNPFFRQLMRLKVRLMVDSANELSYALPDSPKENFFEGLTNPKN